MSAKCNYYAYKRPLNEEVLGEFRYSSTYMRLASGDGRFTSSRNPQPTPPTFAGALLSTYSCGTQADLGDR